MSTPTGTKRIIAVDLDDVLGDENGAVREFHNAVFGTTYTIDDYYKTEAPYWTFWDAVWQVDAGEAARRIDLYKEHKLTVDLQLIPGAVESLSILRKKFELVIVTARGERFVDYTHRWLEKHFPDVFRNVHFVPLWQSDDEATKALICREIGATYLIDDAPEHCRLAAEVGIEALLFGDYGWNRWEELPNTVTRVKNWTEVLRYFHGRD